MLVGKPVTDGLGRAPDERAVQAAAVTHNRRKEGAVSAEAAWLQGNVIAHFERAALAASLVEPQEFDDRDIYNVDGGLECSTGPIYQPIDSPCHLGDAQRKLFDELLNLIYDTGVDCPRSEGANIVAAVPIVDLLQWVIRGVVALPHYDRKQQAHLAVRKLADEGRTRLANDGPPQPFDTVVGFAERVADALERHIDMRLKIVLRDH